MAASGADDGDQNPVGDCYLVAMLSAIAWANHDKVRQMVSDRRRTSPANDPAWMRTRKHRQRRHLTAGGEGLVRRRPATGAAGATPTPAASPASGRRCSRR